MKAVSNSQTETLLLEKVFQKRQKSFLIIQEKNIHEQRLLFKEKTQTSVEVKNEELEANVVKSHKYLYMIRREKNNST